MTFDFKRRLVLGFSGATAAAVGLAITLAPHAFYAGYGIVLSPQPNLMSELRAPGANLAALGLLIFAGAFYDRIAQAAAVLGAVVFSAFVLGRTVSLAFDGRPSDSILAAFGLEVVLAILCFWVVGQKGANEDAERGARHAA